MIRPDQLEFPAVEFTLDQELGSYYQDFSHAVTLVEGEYHGPIGDDGVPRIALPDGSSVPNAITIAQYALGNLQRMLTGERDRGAVARRQLEWLVAAQESSGLVAGCWMMMHDNRKYPWLVAPWTSALASGNALSALLRGWQVFGDQAYMDAAVAAYTGLHANADLTRESAEDLWYEEYPGSPAVHVLNGHVYALLGVADFARAVGDPSAERRWRKAADTTLRHLDGFDSGYWSLYDLRFRELASYHYHLNIHLPQLVILERLTGESTFGSRAHRWSDYLNSSRSRVRVQLGYRLHRFRRGR